MSTTDQTIRLNAVLVSELRADRGTRRAYVDSIRWQTLQQLSEWKGPLAQNVPIARQILRKVLEGRLVFMPRHEGDEHEYEFSGEGSLTKFFGGMEPLSNAMAPPPAMTPCGDGRRNRRPSYRH